MALQQMEISKNQWADEFKFQQEQAGISNNQWQQQFDYNALMDSKSQQAAMGEALLSAGIMPDANQLAAMGLTAAKAQEFITALQLEKQLRAEEEASSKAMTLSQAKALAEDGVFTEESLAVFYANGYTDDILRKNYRYTPPSPSTEGWSDGYKTTQNANGVKASEWDYVKNNVLQNLMSKNFGAVSKYLDMVADGFSESQWAEIQKMLDAYGFVYTAY